MVSQHHGIYLAKRHVWLIVVVITCTITTYLPPCLGRLDHFLTGNATVESHHSQVLESSKTSIHTVLSFFSWKKKRDETLEILLPRQVRPSFHFTQLLPFQQSLRQLLHSSRHPEARQIPGCNEHVEWFPNVLCCLIS